MGAESTTRSETSRHLAVIVGALDSQSNGQTIHANVADAAHMSRRLADLRPMNWFPFFRHQEPKGAAVLALQPQVDAAIDRLLTLTDPRVALLDRYRERLAAAAEVACRYAQSIAASLPAELDANPARWGSCDSLHAFFMGPDEIAQVYGSSNDLRRLFRSDSTCEAAHTVLAMRLVEQKVLGMALEGDALRREVAQTTLSFSCHRVVLCTASEARLRDAVVWRVIDHLALRALARLTRMKDRRSELKVERALLMARLRIHERRGAGLDGKQAANGDLVQLERELRSNEQAISAVGGGTAGLDRTIDTLREVLGAPTESVRCTYRRLKLSPVNVVLDTPGVEPQREIGFVEVYHDAEPPVTVAMMPTRFSRSALPPQVPSLAGRGMSLL